MPRCVVTTRDPDDGRTDAPVLAALAALRGKRDVTFGLWCEVAAAGTASGSATRWLPRDDHLADPGALLAGAASCVTRT